MQQVRNHRESQRRQYGLGEKARSLGFEDVMVIDDDLGRSGTGLQERAGFGRLLAAVCEGRVGAVVALEASRLARNNRDWHHLVDLCALTSTLVIDDDGVYDPRLMNDRLLLGLKGTMSEFELGLLRQRAQEARMDMVRRGTVMWEVPVGYVRDDQRIELTPDLQVQEAIRGVFSKFRQLGSARQVLLWYRQEQLPLPHLIPASCGRQVSSLLPSSSRVLHFLKNPFYAGAFVYGRSATRTVVESGRARRTYQRELPLSEWDVLILDHHEAYIPWDEYLENQKVLESNRGMHGNMKSKGGAPREGSALLAGLLRCGRCGRMFHVVYSGSSGHVLRYSCKAGSVNHGTDPCVSVAGMRLDQAVSSKVLEALQPVALEASLASVDELTKRDDEKRQALELAVEKARYEIVRARRQYDAVDPENRLVARELESRWEKTLHDARELECRLDALESSERPLSEQQHQRLLELGSDLELLWNDPRASTPLKQRILRTVLEEIVVDVQDTPPEAVLHLHWAGGVHTTLRVPKNREGRTLQCTDRDVVELMRELAKVCRDREVAHILNRLGYRTGSGNTWKEARVRSHRAYHQIPRFDERNRENWLTLTDAAQALGVNACVVRRLLADGVLPGRQVVPHAPWIIDRKNLDRPDVKAAVKTVHEGRRKAPRDVPGQLQLPFNQ
jgi:DNA invertase Pin-like site-specific DNA recombinase